MRILCTKATRIEVAPKKYGDLDAHHEYYVDDKQAKELITQGRAVELDAAGRRVENKPARKPAAHRRASEQKPAGPAGKPGSRRRTKATRPPENKTGPAPASEPAKAPEAASPADETGDS